jgi:hypothetical protein
MKHRYLEVTFRHGKPLVAYLHLPRSLAAKAVRTTDEGHGLRVDFDASGAPIGVEITTPQAVTIADLNDLLARLAVPPVPMEEWAPLRAA